MSTPPSPDTAARPPRPTGPQIQLPAPQVPMSEPRPPSQTIVTTITPTTTTTTTTTTPTSNSITIQQQSQPVPTSTPTGPLQASIPGVRPQITVPTSTTGVPGVRHGEYLVLLAPNPRQPGVQGIRYPFLPIQRHQMMATPGATILQRPALIRGVTQPGMGVHQTVIPTSQPFGLAGVPASIAPGSPILHQATNMISSPSTAPSQMTPDDALTKGTNFFNSLLTKMHIKSKKTTLTNLIQALIDGKKTSEEFATALQKELNSGPQIQLVPFLDLLLPHLRQSMNAGHTHLPGIRPPNMQMSVVMQQKTTPIIRPLMPSTSSPIREAQNSNTIMTPNSTITIPPTLATPVQAGTIVAASAATSMPAPSPLGPPPAKKKKIPLPPGQKSAYAIKKEAREARKREKELAASSQGIKIEGVDDKSDGDSSRLDRITPKVKPDKSRRQEKQKKSEKQLESLSAALRDDDDVNDVAAMGGVNLAEESQKIMASGAELVGTQIRSCKDEPFFDLTALSTKISRIVKEHNLSEPTIEVITMISHATQERLKDIVERLGVLADHRAENLKLNPKYEVSNDIKGQMKFLAELDRIEKRRYEEQERELLLRVAKSRSRVDDPEQQKLRQKAKDMQRVEQEEVRQREANQTALLAIGPRKKPKTSTASSISSFSQSSVFRDPNKVVEVRTDSSSRRMKRVNMRDLQILLELDRMHLDRLVKISAQ